MNLKHFLQKKLFVFVFTFVMFSMSVMSIHCSASTSNISSSNGICVYAWNDFMENMIKYYYLDEYPEHSSKIKVFNFECGGQSEDYLNQITELVSNEDNNTAVVLVDEIVLENFVDTGKYVSMNSIGITDSDLEGTYPYALKAGTFNDELMALPVAINPMNFFYDVSIAKKVLGTADPVKIQSMINTPEKFIAVAAKMKASGYYMTSSVGDLKMACSSPIITDDQLKDLKFVINGLQDNFYTHNTLMYTEDYFNDMTSGKVFGWFGSTYFNKTMFYGDLSKMATCVGPVSANWGSSWVLVSNAGKQDELAAQVVKELCFNPSVATGAWKSAQSLPGNKAGASQVVYNSGEEGLYYNGQSDMEVFDTVAQCIGIECPHPKSYSDGAFASTCKVQGYTGDQKCLMCDALLKKGTNVPLSNMHKFSAGILTKKATCITPGEKTYTCNVCGHTQIEKTALSTVHVSNAGQITKSATCTQAGVKTYTCTLCDKTLRKEAIPALDHLWGNGVVTRKATTTKCGVKTYTCKRCQKTYQESIAKLPLKKQTIKVSKKASKTVTYKAKNLKKKKATFNISAKAKGKITYKVKKGSSKYITVSSKGKVTLKKGCKKGTYKILVTAKATSKYKKATKTIVIKVK